MSKSVLIVNGSPRKDGRTVTLLTEARKLATEAGYDIDWVDLVDYDVGPCLGCRACKSTGSCVQDDGMRELYGKIEAADVIVMGSPIYFSEVNGMFKCFFDRWFALLKDSDRPGVLYTSRLDENKKVAMVFPCGNIEGHVLYHGVAIRFTGTISNMFGIKDVNSAMVAPKRNEPDIMVSHQAVDFFTALKSQLQQ